MKNIFNSIILVVLLMIACFSSLAQNPDNTNLEKQLLTIAGTFRTKYRYSEVRLTINKEVNLTFDGNRYYWLSVPALNELRTIATVVNVSDKIGSTSNYCNKILAHEINKYIVGQLMQIEDSLFKQGKEPSNVTLLIKQAIFSELKYCTRFTDSYYIFDKLKKRHYSPEAISEIKALLNHPYKTNEEAKIVLASLKPQYTILDTIGFTDKIKEYKNILVEHDKNLMELNIYKDKAKAANINIKEWLNSNDTTGFEEKFYSSLKRESELESYTRKIGNWMSESQKSKMTLKHWLDSLQAVEDTQFINDYIKESVVLWPVISAIGQSYMKELAPDIEQLIATGILNEDKKNEAMLQLARMQYKEYEKEAIQRIENEIKQTDGSDYGALDKLFEKLVYINTQESFYATAPLLLNQNDFNNLFTTVPINALFFVQLKQHIYNFPWDEKMEIKELEKKEIYIYSFNDPWDVNNYLHKDFLKQIYQWMIANRGKYEIAQEQ